VTVPRATADLPPFENYAMAGRTYRYAEREPLYPFGFGLGYTRWTLGPIRVFPEPPDSRQPVTVRVTVTNVGARAGRTVIQYYLVPPDGATGPRLTLIDFSVVELPANASAECTVAIPPGAWSLHDEHGARVHTPGAWQVVAAFAAPVPRAQALGVPAPQSLRIDVR
jgi:beta-glucosidase